MIAVLSKATARLDRGEKLRLYAESGVREYWLVDTAARQIEFLVDRQGRLVVVLAQDDRYRSEERPAVSLDVAALWRSLDDRLR